MKDALGPIGDLRNYREIITAASLSQESEGAPDDAAITLDVWERSCHHHESTLVTFAENGDVIFVEHDVGSALDDFHDVTGLDMRTKYPVSASERMKLFSHFLGEHMPAAETERRAKLVEALIVHLKRTGIKSLFTEAGLHIDGMADGASPKAAAEKAIFDVILVDGGADTIAVIRELHRLIPGLSIREAKALVERGRATIMEDVEKEEALITKTRLSVPGAKVVIK